jgi:hypothetical protein
MNDRQARPAWQRIIRGVGRFIVVVAVVGYTVLDELLFPVFRPLIGWLTGLRLFQRIGEALGRLPPYVALVALGVPFLVIEPAKLLAVWWAAQGHIVQGTVMLLVAQVLSLLVCERIFHAAYEPLMRIGWLKALLGWLFGLRDRAIAMARSTVAWKVAVRLARSVARWWRRMIAALR